ncbi:hypothetical protein K1719_035921 [Acacia pycnantha]|nr:hypothetical protein K1719_037590 [Acacia pycnantha]KAI9082181.1 hypothetical protein K1719_035921 [Acacia pycnantha]
MDNILGLLKLRIKKGISLAIRDTRSSDPYVVVTSGDQKVKTRVIKNNRNPQWDDELTLSVKDVNSPIHLAVFDQDTFTADDKMGDAEIDIKPYLQCLKMNLANLPNGSVLKKIQPDGKNYLSEESSCILKNGKVTQEMTLALRNVECGHVVVEIEWKEVPGCKGLSGIEI